MDGPLIVIGICAAIVGGLIYLAWQGENQWQAWAKEHDCKVVGAMGPTNGFGVDSKGMPITTYIAGKTGYACNNGVTYWR